MCCLLVLHRQMFPKYGVFPDICPWTNACLFKHGCNDTSCDNSMCVMFPKSLPCHAGRLLTAVVSLFWHPSLKSSTYTVTTSRADFICSIAVTGRKFPIAKSIPISSHKFVWLFVWTDVEYRQSWSLLEPAPAISILN